MTDKELQPIKDIILTTAYNGENYLLIPIKDIIEISVDVYGMDIRPEISLKYYGGGKT